MSCSHSWHSRTPQSELAELERSIVRFDETLNTQGSELKVFNSKSDHPNLKPFQCSICFDAVDVGSGYVISGCEHAFCQNCVIDYLNDKIKDASVLEIPCLQQSCPEFLGYCDVKSLVSPQVFLKYLDFSFLAALKDEPNFRWCPNPKGCGNAFVWDGDCQHLVCDLCDFQFCFQCQQAWHSGSCQEFFKEQLENGGDEAEFYKWAVINSKQCPNCGVRIEKSGGCNQICCFNCEWKFCWLCMRKCGPYHFDPYNITGCPGRQFSADKDPTLVTKIGYVVVGTMWLTAMILPALVMLPPVLLYQGYRVGKRRYRARKR